MRNNDLVKNFIELIDKSEKEDVYQKFLEENTKLIPTKPFELNHGVHFELVISKMKISDSYISDFFYLSKSSDTWNIVFIEIERPNVKLFNMDGTISGALNKGISQINDWNSFFNINSNKNAFLDNLIINKLMGFNPSFLENECEFKYILIIGRRDELFNNPKFRTKLKRLENENFSILSYDSLYENINGKNSYYIGKIKNGILEINTKNYVTSRLFQYFPTNLIKIKPELKKLLENYVLKEEPSDIILKYAYKNRHIAFNEYIHREIFEELKTH